MSTLNQHAATTNKIIELIRTTAGRMSWWAENPATVRWLYPNQLGGGMRSYQRAFKKDLDSIDRIADYYDYIEKRSVAERLRLYRKNLAIIAFGDDGLFDRERHELLQQAARELPRETSRRAPMVSSGEPFSLDIKRLLAENMDRMFAEKSEREKTAIRAIMRDAAGYLNRLAGMLAGDSGTDGATEPPAPAEASGLSGTPATAAAPGTKLTVPMAAEPTAQDAGAGTVSAPATKTAEPTPAEIRAWQSYKWVCEEHPHLIREAQRISKSYTKEMHRVAVNESPSFIDEEGERIAKPNFDSWQRNLRGYIQKAPKKPDTRPDIRPEEIATRDNIQDLADVKNQLEP